MCGRHTFTVTARSLADAFGMIPYGFDMITGHNISPGRYVIIVRPEKGQLVPDVAFWVLGFIRNLLFLICI